MTRLSSLPYSGPPLSGSLLPLVPATILWSVLMLSVSMPLEGALVRFRANYAPSRVQLPQDSDYESPINDMKSYFGMLKRVRRLEGWAGLYKGIMPSIIEVVLSVVLIGPLVALFSVTPVYANHTPAYMILITVPILLLLPVEIIKNRVITTPYKFTAFQPSIALQVLLSPAERAHPLRLYLLPGVAVAAIVPVFFIVGASLLWRFITLKLVFHHGLKLWSWTWSHTVYRFFSVVLLVLTSALVTPLRVMTIRLSLQCLQREEPNDPEQQSGHHHDNSQAVYTSEEVVEIRAGLPPYTSAKDCAKRIMEEEGKQALFRGWWITALGLAPMFLST